LDKAIKKSAEILADAKYPILYGWSSTNCEATRVGLELAEEVGGVMDNTATICHGPSIIGIQDVGIPTCTLGQLRHRADLVFYWGCDPWSAHPRHVDRYTNFSSGRFQGSTWRRNVKRAASTQTLKKLKRAAGLTMSHKVPELSNKDKGLPEFMLRRERKMVVVDVRKTRSAECADYFIQVKPNSDYDLLQAFRMLIRDEEIDVDEVAGIPIDLMEEIADVMVSCNFGILFFGVGLTMSAGKHRNIDSAISLTRDLNKRTKFAIMPMRGHFNVTGANVVSTWQTGYPFAVDFSLGYPRYNPGETSVVDILCRDESDAALVVASDPVAHFPQKAVENLVRKPLITIDPEVSPTSLMSDVVIPSAFVGIENSGTAYRMDHVPLPLKKVVEPPEICHPDQEILKKILNEVRKIRRLPA
jgi:formylmethanofuran dehydrogenase subunit B